MRLLGLRISSWESDSLDHNPRYCEGSVLFIHRRGRSFLFIHPRGRFQVLIIQSLLSDGTHRRERKAHTAQFVVSVFAAGEDLALVGGELRLERRFCCAVVPGSEALADLIVTAKRRVFLYSRFIIRFVFCVLLSPITVLEAVLSYYCLYYTQISVDCSEGASMQSKVAFPFDFNQQVYSDKSLSHFFFLVPMAAPFLPWPQIILVLTLMFPFLCTHVRTFGLSWTVFELQQVLEETPSGETCRMWQCVFASGH